MHLPGADLVRAQKAPGESRYGENGDKKKRVSEEKAVGEMLWARVPWCGGMVVGGRTRRLTCPLLPNANDILPLFMAHCH
jgi:hypothetical protein